MRILLALGGSPKRFIHGGLEYRSILVSFEYKNLAEFALSFKTLDYLLLDSGAFSAWSVGRKIDIQEYSDWIDMIKSKGTFINQIRAINLDVITNKNDSPATLRQAYEQSMKNLMFLQSKGHSVLPVFHQFEDIAVLKEYAQEFPFVCLSPNNKESTVSKRKYLDQCFSVIGSTVKTHGLAVTAEELVFRYPWYSVDSSIDQVPYRFGSVGIKRRHLAPSVREKATQNKYYTQALSLGIRKHLVWMEQSATKLWESRGVIWKD